MNAPSRQATAAVLLDDPVAADPARFGGKAAALAIAARSGLPVPPGVALAPDLVAGIERGDPAALHALARAVAPLAPLVAVRSSAIGEDDTAASSAGQYRTCLAVRRADVARAVAEVAASAGSASARAYRRRMGVADPPGMAVVVQTLVEAEVSGVLFTRHPVTGADERLVEASYGLGEGVVSGLVTPDLYRLGSAGEVLEARIGLKDVAVRAGPGGGTTETAVDADRAGRPALDDDVLAALAVLATRCEQVFGGPRDVEWALAGGALHLLQCRPVTT